MSKHPVDALKELGMPMSPEHEAEMRAICDTPVCFACGQPVEIDSPIRIDGLLDASPRIITRVMDDSVETKDGAA